MVDEPLRLGFVSGGAAFVVLEVAQRRLGVGLRTQQEVSLPGRAVLSLGGPKVHDGKVEASTASVVPVTDLLGQLYTFLVMLSCSLGLADCPVEFT